MHNNYEKSLIAGIIVKKFSQVQYPCAKRIRCLEITGWVGEDLGYVNYAGTQRYITTFTHSLV